MTDIFGPGSNATNVATARPADTRVMGATDTWWKDCTSPANNDGTRMPAAVLNNLVANIRSIIRGAGIADDPAADDLIRKAILAQIQMQDVNFAVAAGTANAVTASLTPAPAALTDGMPVRLRVGTVNTGNVTLNLNGLGAKSVKSPAGGEITPGAFTGVVSLVYSSAASAFVMVSSSTSLPGNANGLLKNDGSGVLSWIGAGTIVKPAAILADVRAAGATGGSLAASTWTTRQLNSDLLSSSGVLTLASNIFTPVKNCYARFKTPAYAVGRYKSRLYCTTDALAVAYSEMGYTGNNSTVDTMTSVQGIGFCTGGKSYRIDTWSQSTGANAGGLDNLDGSTNLFSTVELYEL